MTHRTNGTAWIVFSYGIQELARLSADHATSEEVREARDLLAHEYGLHPEEISVRAEGPGFDGSAAAGETR